MSSSKCTGALRDHRRRASGSAEAIKRTLVGGHNQMAIRGQDANRITIHFRLPDNGRLAACRRNRDGGDFVFTRRVEPVAGDDADRERLGQLPHLRKTQPPQEFATSQPFGEADAPRGVAQIVGAYLVISRRTHLGLATLDYFLGFGFVFAAKHHCLGEDGQIDVADFVAAIGAGRLHDGPRTHRRDLIWPERCLDSRKCSNRRRAGIEEHKPTPTLHFHADDFLFDQPLGPSRRLAAKLGEVLDSHWPRGQQIQGSRAGGIDRTSLKPEIGVPPDLPVLACRFGQFAIEGIVGVEFAGLRIEEGGDGASAGHGEPAGKLRERAVRRQPEVCHLAVLVESVADLADLRVAPLHRTGTGIHGEDEHPFAGPHTAAEEHGVADEHRSASRRPARAEAAIHQHPVIRAVSRCAAGFPTLFADACVHAVEVAVIGSEPNAAIGCNGRKTHRSFGDESPLLRTRGEIVGDHTVGHVGGHKEQPTRCHRLIAHIGAKPEMVIKRGIRLRQCA